MFLAVEIIKKKRRGLALTTEEIDFFIQNYTLGKLPDYQMSALLMAIFFNGMTDIETNSLTKSMLNSGITIDLKSIEGFKVDKHSTGGVGDKTSLILGPIVAAAGIPVPMISGRGLGHTGGTLDKLESIPGFNTQLSLEQFISAIKKIKICFIGQTGDICPADKKIYSLRDVTATVESLPLICASIMSKKLAEGADGLVLDVKYGDGAFMKTAEKAEELALALMSIAKSNGKKVSAVLSDMNQPLGRFAGNALEIKECVEIMQNKSFLNSLGRDVYKETRDLSIKLSGIMIFLSGKVKTEAEGILLAEQMLTSGNALEKFKELCEIHCGSLKDLPEPKNVLEVESKVSGFVHSYQTERIGMCGVKIKAGRSVISDKIEPTAGIEFFYKIGEKVNSGDILFRIYGADLELLKTVKQDLQETVVIKSEKLNSLPLVLKTIY